MAKKKARQLTETQRDRLDAEWAFINAAREGMNIFRRKPDQTTYRQAARWGEEIAPEVLDPDRRVINPDRESHVARFYRQKSIAESTLHSRIVTPLELISADIESLRTVMVISPDADSVESRLEHLEKIRIELTPRRHTENQVIFRDAYQVERYLPITKRGQGYQEYTMHDSRRLRVRVLHPDHPESKTGADLIYELHDVEEETVRVVMLQYKMWDGKTFPYDQRMDGQLEKLMGLGCRGQFCLSPGGDSEVKSYRMPYCSVFLRPTDRLQDPDASLKSSGMHIPLCRVHKSWTATDRGAKVLKREDIERQSVSHAIFEYLFATSLLGSRELEWSLMEKYYEDWGILDGDDRLVLHAQEFNAPKSA